MTHSALDSIATQLESAQSRDRMLALAALRDVPAPAAVPLIKKVLGPIQKSELLIKPIRNHPQGHIAPGPAQFNYTGLILW